MYVHGLSEAISFFAKTLPFIDWSEAKMSKFNTDGKSLRPVGRSIDRSVCLSVRHMPFAYNLRWVLFVALSKSYTALGFRTCMKRLGRSLRRSFVPFGTLSLSAFYGISQCFRLVATSAGKKFWARRCHTSKAGSASSLTVTCTLVVWCFMSNNSQPALFTNYGNSKFRTCLSSQIKVCQRNSLEIQSSANNMCFLLDAKNFARFCSKELFLSYSR